MQQQPMATGDSPGPAPEVEWRALLNAVHAGQRDAQEKLAERVFDDLRAMARRKMGSGKQGATLQPTILASDTLMQLIRQRQKFDGPGHLFAIASRVMMRILVDYHRRRHALKRGAGLRVSLDPDQMASPESSDVDVEALNAALEKLEKLDQRKADVVKYRVLWGLTMPEISDALQVALATVERDWAFARAWFAKELAHNV
jgi:RNA polymerase sigma factor (TIGR02999 family)